MSLHHKLPAQQQLSGTHDPSLSPELRVKERMDPQRRCWCRHQPCGPRAQPGVACCSTGSGAFGAAARQTSSSGATWCRPAAPQTAPPAALGWAWPGAPRARRHNPVHTIGRSSFESEAHRQQLHCSSNDLSHHSVAQLATLCSATPQAGLTSADDEPERLCKPACSSAPAATRLGLTISR